MIPYPSVCYIVGRKCRIEANGHEYIGEPFIVFPTEDDARTAADMISKVSGSEPMVVEAAFYEAPHET